MLTTDDLLILSYSRSHDFLEEVAHDRQVREAEEALKQNKQEKPNQIRVDKTKPKHLKHQHAPAHS